MAWSAITEKYVGKTAKRNGCYILKKLCDTWNCQPVNAIGSVGCFAIESQCNPAAYNKEEKSGKATYSSANGATKYGAGIALWSSTRKSSAQRMFRRYTPIETWTLDQLIELVILTCNKNFVNDLKACKTARASTDRWLRGYENGGGGQIYIKKDGTRSGYASEEQIDAYRWCNGYYGAMQNRTTAAVAILKAYLGGEVGADVIGDVSSFGSSSGSGAVPSDWDGTSVESSYESVLSSAGDNIYSALNVKNADNSVKHTRIYQYSKAGVVVDEMSLPLDLKTDTTTTTDVTTEKNGSSDTTSTKSNSSTESSTKSNSSKSETNSDGTTTLTTTTTNTSQKIDPDTGEITTTTTNTVTTTTGTTSDKPETPGNRSDAAGEDALASAGVTYPLIRINDHYFAADEIKSFELSTVDFTPTVRFHCTVKTTSMLKSNIIKDGDMMAVFIQPTTAAYKSLRCDFLITTCISNEITSNNGVDYDYIICGELYIPDLYNANMTFAFSGSSRDALIYSAEQLKLAFFFNDPENTDDALMWYCTTNMPEEDVNRPSNIKEFILDVCSHSWKNFESFFDCWIDPRYGLTFLNINKQLGESGEDEKIDIVPFQSAILAHRGKDAKRGEKTETESKADVDKGLVRPQGKIITNISTDADANSPLYAISFKPIDQSGEISRIMGINLTASFTNGNWSSGANEPKQFTMSYSIPYNDWKIQHGFYMLIGPGKNESYVPGDSYDSFVKSNNKKVGGAITDIQADTDGETIEDTGDNMLATGAVNKFYDAAVEHNRINLLLLLKKYVEVELNGCNFAIMRGEKIPCMIVDLDKANNLENLSDEKLVTSLIYETFSGWFIIDGIRYVFDVNNSDKYGTQWRTYVKLIRREWPISGKSICPDANTDTSNSTEVTIENNVSSGSSVESTVSEDTTTDTDASSAETTTESSTTTEEDIPEDGVPTTGLKDELIKMYDQLKNVFPDLKLVRGRYYAVDQSTGNVIDDYCLPSYATSGGLYIVANENKQIKEVDCEFAHRFYGMCFNVTSDLYTPENMLQIIMNNIPLLEWIWGDGFAPTITTVTINSKDIKTLLITQGYYKYVKLFWENLFLIYPTCKKTFSYWALLSLKFKISFSVTACKDANGNTVKTRDLIGINDS